MDVKTTRYRFRIRNYNSVSQAAGQAVTDKGLASGLSNTSTSAYEIGQFAGSASTTLVSTDFAIPTEVGFCTSAWITASNQQINPNQEYMLAFAFQGNATQSIACDRACASGSRTTSQLNWTAAAP